MDVFLESIKIILLGIIEGITEWLPISSTGHMMLFNAVWQMEQTDKFQNVFNYFVQFGAILAVVVLFWKKLFPFTFQKEQGKLKLHSEKPIWVLWGKVAIACIPAAIAGVLIDMPDQAWVIALTLILYGVAFIVIEKWNAKKEAKVDTVHGISWAQAAIIGGAQVLAIIPGTSRSGVTILAALLLGISRPAGAEFTFFLAIPVMVGASLLEFLKVGFAFSPIEFYYLFLGFFVAFGVSLLCIKLLMDFVKKHDFAVFGWYRIALGVIVLAALVIPSFF